MEWMPVLFTARPEHLCPRLHMQVIKWWDLPGQSDQPSADAHPVLSWSELLVRPDYPTAPPPTHTHTHTHKHKHKHKVILVTIELPHTNTNLYISRSQLIKSDPFTAFLHHICDIIGVTRGQIKQVKGHPNPVSINTTVLFLITLRLKLINATFINLN